MSQACTETSSGCSLQQYAYPFVAVQVAVPSVGRGGGGGRNYSKVDFIPHRRSEHSSKAEIDDIVMRQQHFRPAHVKAVSTEAEKDK